MSFSLSFPTAATPPSLAELAAWLEEEGEAWASEDGEALVLRALPLRLLHTGSGLRGEVEVGLTTPLSRLVRVLFALSSRVGADVRVVGVGLVDRAALWLRLADEQDRLRLAAALARVDEHPQRDEILRGLWSLLAVAAPGRDARWDALRERVVELHDSGDLTDPGFVRVTSEPPLPPVPLDPPIHLLAWRWLGEAWPALADARSSA